MGSPLGSAAAGGERKRLADMVHALRPEHAHSIDEDFFRWRSSDIRTVIVLDIRQLCPIVIGS